MKLFSTFISATLAARECGDYACIESIETVGCLDTCYEDDCHGTQMYCCGELAQNDWDAIIKFQSVTKAAAEAKNIDHNILAAIMSRESRAGRKLESWNGEYGWGKCKTGSCYGWGLMQVDRRFHQPEGAWDSQEHLEQATQILIDQINCISRKFDRWTLPMKTKGGICAYNRGCSHVQNYDGMDIGTDGNDYANDSVCRGQWFKNRGF
uniref:Lysozyme g n=1 Tax=Oikopleura dioica TaxID=34765 RepID=Q7YXC3_OIKDI|nr:goose-type lysozyme 1 [Oikopleura dioica]